jgi:hypothetical protein
MLTLDGSNTQLLLVCSKAHDFSDPLQDTEMKRGVGLQGYVL